MSNWLGVSTQISTVLGKTYTIQESDPIGGGCINQAYRVSDGRLHFFIKLNSSLNFPMFEAEFSGLQEILQSGTIRVPHPVCHGQDGQIAWLVLEYLNLNNGANAKGSDLGEQLAALHRTTSSQFGWYRDNTLGTTPQINGFCTDWIEFWQKHRLGYQLLLAQQNGFNGKLQQLGEQLLLNLHIFFASTQPVPSLLHGDLWSGNYAYDDHGNPVIFDPAVYYGDREADLAMTELFGGFPSDFYSAYRYNYPLDSGYNIRKNVYNLYHILNHLNLFGGSYLYQAEHMMSRLLAEIR